jgi:Spy/CpxP family protein refolding chaperone
MKTTLKKALAPALVLGALLSLLLAVGASAQRGGGPGMRHHGGHSRHGGHGGLMNVERLADYLSLTAAQKTQVEQLREKMKTAMEPLREEHRELAEAVHTALENGADATTVGTAVIASHQHREKMRAIHEQYDGELEAILTPAQLSRWNALKDARKAMRGRPGFADDESED